MKKIIFAIIASSLFSFSAQAADVVCSCTQEEKCSDVTISILEMSPGVYLDIEYAWGERNIEGFATVINNSKTAETIYRLGNFTLVEKDDKFTLPGRPAKCS